MSSHRRLWKGMVYALVAAVVVALAWRLSRPPATPASAPVATQQDPVPHYDLVRTLRFTFTLENTTGKVLENVEFRTYAPVALTSTQRCCKTLEASHPYNLETDGLGNQVMVFRFDTLPPYARQVVNIRAQVEMADTSNRLPLTDPGPFLVAAPYVELDDPGISQTARELRRPEPGETARAAYRWTAEHVRYAGYLREDRGALYALTKRQGDCTEYMYLFMALARANGIPARGVGGYVYVRDSVLHPGDYHNWAEFYLDGAWHLSDPQKHAFMEQQSHYIAFRIIPNDADHTFRRFQRFWHSGGGLRVRMSG